MAIQSAAILKRGNAYFADPRALVVQEGWNVRFDFGELEDLAASIKDQGLLRAIRVRKVDGDKLQVIDGERRKRAIDMLLANGHEFPSGIPVDIVDSKQDEVTSLIQMFASNTGKPFLPMEEAAAFKRMRDAGMTLEGIAKAVGCRHVHVNNTLALLDADPELQEAVKAGAVGSSLAKRIAVVARGDKVKQRELTAAAKSAGKDRKARHKVDAQIEATRRERAESKGKALKIKALSDEQLSELGAAMGKQLQACLAACGLSPEQLQASVSADDKLAAIYSLGALNALKAAAGMKISLKV